MINMVPDSLFLRIVQGSVLLASETKGCALKSLPIICNEIVCARCRRVSILVRSYSCGHCLCLECSPLSNLICVCCKDFIQDSVMLVSPVDRLLSALNAAIQCPYNKSCRAYYSLSAYLMHLHTAHYSRAYLADSSSQKTATAIAPLESGHPGREMILVDSQSPQAVESVIELLCTTPSTENLMDDSKVLYQLQIGDSVFTGTPEALQNDFARIEEAITKCSVFSRKEYQVIVEKTSKAYTSDGVQQGKALNFNIQQLFRWHIYHLAELPNELQQTKVCATLTSVNYTPQFSHLFVNFICQMPSLKSLIIDNETFHFSISTIIQLQNKAVHLRELYIFSCHFDIDLNMLRELRTVWLPTLTTLVIDFSVLTKAFSGTYISMLSTLTFMYLSDFMGHDYLDYRATAAAPGKRQGKQGSLLSNLFFKKHSSPSPKDKEDKRYKPFVLQKIERSSILLKSVSEKPKTSGTKARALSVPIAYASYNHSSSRENSARTSDCSCDNNSFDSSNAPNILEDIRLSATSPLMILNSYHSLLCQRYGTTLGLIHYPISSDLPFLGAWGEEPSGFFGLVFDGVSYDISTVALKLMEDTAIEPLVPLGAFRTSKPLNISCQGEDGKGKRKEKRGRHEKGQDSNHLTKHSLAYLFYTPSFVPSGTVTFTDFCKSFTPECLNLALLLFICRYDVSLEHVRVLVLNLSETLSYRRHILDYVVKSLALRSNADVEQILEYRTKLSFISRRDEPPPKSSEASLSPQCDPDDSTGYDEKVAFFLDSLVALLPYLYRIREIKLGPRSSNMSLLLPPYNGAIYVSLLRLIFVASRRLISIHPAINYILPLLTGVERFRTIDVFYAHVRSVYEMIRGEYFNTHYHTHTSLLEDGKKIGDLEMTSLIDDDPNCTESPGGTFNSLCNITIMTPGGKGLVYGNEIDEVHVSRPFRPFKYSVSSFDFQYEIESTLPPVHPQQLVDLYGHSGGSLKTIDSLADETYIFSHLHRLLQLMPQSNFCFLDLLPLCPPRTVVYCLQLIKEGSGPFSCSSFNAIEMLSIPCSKFFLLDTVTDPTVALLDTLQETIGYRRSGAGNKSDSTSHKQNRYYSFVKYKCMLDKSVYAQSLMAQHRFIRHERRVRQQYKPSIVTLSKPLVLNNSYVHFFFNITPNRIENLYMGLRAFNSNRKQSVEQVDSFSIDASKYIAEIISRFILNYSDLDLLSSVCISSPLLGRTIQEGHASNLDADVSNDNSLVNDDLASPIKKEVTKGIPDPADASVTPDEAKDSAQALPNVLPPRLPTASASAVPAQSSAKVSEENKSKHSDNDPCCFDESCLCSCAVHQSSCICTGGTEFSSLVTIRLISLTLLNVDGLLYSDVNLINKAISVKLLRLLSKDLDSLLPTYNTIGSPNSRGYMSSSHTCIGVFEKYLEESPSHFTELVTTIDRFLSMLFSIPALHTDSTILNMILMQRNALFSQESFQVQKALVSARGTKDKSSQKQTVEELSPISWRVPRLGLQFVLNLKGTRFSIDSSAVGTLSEVKSQVTNTTACTYTNSIITIIKRRDAPELDIDESAHIVFKDHPAPKIHTLDIPSIDGLSIITALHNEEEACASIMESPCAQQALAESLLDAGGPLIDKEAVFLQDPSIEFPTVLPEDSPYQVTPNLRSYVASQRPVALLTICKPLLYYYMIFRVLIGESLKKGESFSPFDGQGNTILIDSPSCSLSDLIVLPIGGASFKPNTCSIFSICKSAILTQNLFRWPSQADLNVLDVPKRLSTKYRLPQNSSNLSEHSHTSIDAYPSDNTEEIIVSIYFAYQLLYTLYKRPPSTTAQHFCLKKPKIALIYGSGKLFKCVDTVISAKLLAFLLTLLATGVLTDVIVDSDVLLRYFPTSMAYNAFILNGSIVSKLYRNGSLVLGWDAVREGVDIPFALYLQLFHEIGTTKLSAESTKPLTYLDLSGTLTTVQSHSIYDYHNYSESQFAEFLKNISTLDQTIGFRTLILPTKVLSLSDLRRIYRLADIVSTSLACTRLHNIVFSSVCSIFKLVDDGPEANAELPANQFNPRTQIRSLFALKQNKCSTLHVYNRNWKDAISFLIHVGSKSKALFTRVCTLDFSPPEDDSGDKSVVISGLFDQTVSSLVLQLISLCIGVDRLVIPPPSVSEERESDIQVLKKWVEKANEMKKLQEMVLNPPNKDIASELRQSFCHLCIG